MLDLPGVLKPVACFEIHLGEAYALGAMPLGRRRVSLVSGGRVFGPGLEGVILPGGSDWQLVRNDDVTEISARFVVQLSGGNYLTVQTRGYRHGPEAIMQALGRGEAVEPDLYYFGSTLTIEAEGEHADLARTVIVGIGSRKGHRVDLAAYALVRGAS